MLPVSDPKLPVPAPPFVAVGTVYGGTLDFSPRSRFSASRIVATGSKSP